MPILTAPKFYIKMDCELASLKTNKYNDHLLNLVSQSLGLNVNLYFNKSSGATVLKCTGKTVFNQILPIFEQNIDWFYWKKDQILLALTVKQIYSEKSHLTEIGLTRLVNLLYGVPNGYKKPLKYWLDLIAIRHWDK